MHLSKPSLLGLVIRGDEAVGAQCLDIETAAILVLACTAHRQAWTEFTDQKRIDDAMRGDAFRKYTFE